MRLLTHNFLQSTVKGAAKGYPLRIQEATSVVVEESEIDEELVERMKSTIEWDGLRSAVSDLCKLKVLDVPEPNPDDSLTALHHLLFNIHILEGILACPETGREFSVKDGIPNMILHEDEI